MLRIIRRNLKAVVVVLIGVFALAIVWANHDWFIVYPDYILAGAALITTAFLAWRRPRFWLPWALATCIVLIPSALSLRGFLRHDVVLWNRTGQPISDGYLSLGGRDDFFGAPDLGLKGFPANMRFTLHWRSWEMRGEYSLLYYLADGPQLGEWQDDPVPEYQNWMRIEILPSGVVATYRKE